MKTNNLIKILLLSTLILSCSSNENSNEENTNNSTSSNSIIGKWIWTTKIANGISTPANPSINGCPRNYIEFKEDNTSVEVHYNSEDNCSMKSYTRGNYVKEGNTIKYPPSTTDNEEILELTNEKMKLLRHDGTITVFEKKP